MTSRSRKLPAAYCSRAFFRFIAIILLEVERTWLISLAEAAVTVTCSGIASALDCSDGEVVEACAVRGLSVSPMCYCADRLARYCSDVCGVDSDTLLCASSCQAYVDHMHKNCSLPDSAMVWPPELVALIVMGCVIGLASLFVIATSLAYKYRAVTGDESRPARSYLWFLLHFGRDEAAGRPVEPVNNFPAHPTDAKVVANNRNSAAVPHRTVLSHDSVDRHENEDLDDLLQRSV